MAKTNEDMGMEIFGFFTEVSIIAQLSISLFERHLPEGLTHSQFGVLNWFHRVDDEAATPGRLAAAFQVTPGAMTNTLKRLGAKALIKVEPDASSGRRKRGYHHPGGARHAAASLRVSGAAAGGICGGIFGGYHRWADQRISEDQGISGRISLPRIHKA
ncbi:MAG: MarR family winged helix-turn-helix transcriptional regulator [Pseudohongiellaceae bacterium]